MGQSTQTTQKGLIRGIRRWDLVAMSINGIIGAGIFGLPSKAYALVGPYSLIAFIACANRLGVMRPFVPRCITIVGGNRCLDR